MIPTLLYSKMATPIDRVDIEPANGLAAYGGPIMYHVWERTDEAIANAFGGPTLRYLREYRGMVAAHDLVWLIFPVKEPPTHVTFMDPAISERVPAK